MSGTRIWVFGATIVIVAVIVLGYLLGIAPKLAEAQTALLSAVEVEAQNAQKEAALIALREQFESLDELEDELLDAREEVPGSDELEDFVDSIQLAATATGVVVKKITNAEASMFGVAAADAEAPTVQTIAGPAQLYSLQVTIEVGGTPEAAIAFSRIMQEGSRVFFVPSFSYNGDTAVGTVLGYIYVVAMPTGTDVAPPSDTPEETPEETPAPTATPVPTETPAPTETPVP